MEIDPSDLELQEDDEPKEDVWFERACEEIPLLIKKLKVATDREIKVRLEGEPFPGPPGPFPWIIQRAIKVLTGKQVLRTHGYTGRRRVGKGVPNTFYSLYEIPYKEIEELIQLKRRISADVNNVLTGEAPASFHAEELFREAFEDLGFKILGRDVSELNGERVVGISGKEPPNLDFAVRRDSVKYGVDVKNWIRYEFGTRREVDLKIAAAKQLKTVPFIIPRYIDREWTNRIIYGKTQGLVCEYKLLIIPATMRSLVEDAEKYLGYPIVATDTLPKKLCDRIEDIHKRYLSLKR